MAVLIVTDPLAGAIGLISPLAGGGFLVNVLVDGHCAALDSIQPVPGVGIGIIDLFAAALSTLLHALFVPVLLAVFFNPAVLLAVLGGVVLAVEVDSSGGNAAGLLYSCIHELCACAVLIGAGKDSHCGNGGLFSGTMNGALLGLSRRSLFKGCFKLHMVCRHSEGILATVLQLTRNLFVLTAIIIHHLGQFVGGTIRRDGSCNICTCREAGLTISKCDSAFAFAQHLNFNAILNGRKLYADIYIAVRHFESIGIFIYLCGGDINFARCNRYACQLSQQSICIYRVDLQCNSITRL